MYEKIIVHRGQVHLDELVACAFALALAYPPGSPVLPPVFRREPTEEELEDPCVLVLDVGGRHEPELNNFDHHQRAREEPAECAASLLLAHRAPRVLEQLHQLTGWFEAMTIVDVRGPYAYAQSRGYPGFPFELAGALEAPIKELFERYEQEQPVHRQLVELLWKVGFQHLQFLQGRQEALAAMDREARLVDVQGVPGVVYLARDVSAMNLWRETKHPELAFSITIDERGEGLSLYRFNDDPRLDFSRLEGDPRMLFVHKGGFIAKTRQVDLREAQELVARALV